MYILFYPLKFPSTPVLILFKVLQHHNNLLWPRTGLEPAFIHRYRDYLQTCAYFLIQHLAARDTVFPPVRLCILHTPLRLGWLFHLPTRSYGREDRTRTCDPWFGLYIRFELMILPLLYRLTNFSAYWLTVTKTSVLANWTTSRNVWFSIIVLLGSGCGSRTQLSWDYEPQMIFEHPYFRSSYPFHSPANFLFISKNLSRQPDSNR